MCDIKPRLLLVFIGVFFDRDCDENWIEVLSDLCEALGSKLYVAPDSGQTANIDVCYFESHNGDLDDWNRTMTELGFFESQGGFAIHIWSMAQLPSLLHWAVLNHVHVHPIDLTFLETHTKNA